jgi:hypothetical protein
MQGAYLDLKYIPHGHYARTALLESILTHEYRS